jgi:hypothetical protein
MSIFVIGQFPSAHRTSIAHAIDRAGVRAAFFDTPDQLVEMDEAQGRRPYCFFVDAQRADAESLVGWIRDQGHLFDVPVIALVPIPTQSAFHSGLEMGADDSVLIHDAPGITRRAASLAALRRDDRRSATIRRAVICDPNERKRRLVGRALRCAGYELSFAVDLEGASRQLSAGPADLLVMSDRIGRGRISGAIAGLRVGAGDPELPVVVTGSIDSSVAGALRRLGHVRHLGDAQPLYHLLFHANELMSEHASNMRTSARVLHSTLCAFRQAGEMSVSYGLTYNVSRAGVFVRTLDPIPRGSKTWLELRPSDGECAVHLRGDVVWLCKADPSVASPAPPGFGVQLDLEASPREDAARFVAAYERLLTEEDERSPRRPEAPATLAMHA